MEGWFEDPWRPPNQERTNATLATVNAKSSSRSLPTDLTSILKDLAAKQGLLIISMITIAALWLDDFGDGRLSDRQATDFGSFLWHDPRWISTVLCEIFGYLVLPSATYILELDYLILINSPFWAEPKGGRMNPDVTVFATVKFTMRSTTGNE
jgi:hypothetical protein